MKLSEGLETLELSGWHIGFCLLLLLALAMNNSFIQDDAFISFRYARNLVEHGELAWNAGERVAGYTNFLWTLILTLPFLMGLDPVRFSQALGLICALGTLYFTYRIARRLSGSAFGGLLAMVLLGTNFSFSAYATGGLETQLQTCLFAAVAMTAIILPGECPGGRRLCIRLGLLGAAAILTRLDSALVFAALALPVAWRLLRQTDAGRIKIRRLCALLMPPITAAIGLMLWMNSYYGEPLPNTFAVKTGGFSPAIAGQGLLYLFEYFTSTYHLPLLLLPLVMFRRVWRTQPLRLLGITILLWAAYVVYVGGGFMEFRFLVPVMPLAFALIASLLMATRDWRVQAACALLLVGGSYWHATSFNYERGIESIRQLEGHVSSDNQNWRGVGVALGRVFGQAEHPPVIAVTAAGAIPFYSGLPTVDMLGLNDRYVAREGLPLTNRPGHLRLAPSAYLVERGVNLLIGHPIVVHNSQQSKASYEVADLANFSLLDMSAELLPEGARILELPLELNYRVFILYLTRTPEIDRIIEGRQLPLRPITR
jgi:arabinofuranosyltransferase